MRVSLIVGIWFITHIYNDLMQNRSIASELAMEIL